jgi:hypothetical protein
VGDGVVSIDADAFEDIIDKFTAVVTELDPGQAPTRAQIEQLSAAVDALEVILLDLRDQQAADDVPAGDEPDVTRPPDA